MLFLFIGLLQSRHIIDMAVMFAVGAKDQITSSGLSEKIFQIAVKLKRIHIFEDVDYNNLPEIKEYRIALVEFYQIQL